jgi:exodeoxyribonuclease VII small subunit
MSPKKDKFNFERALTELETLVERMEKGQQSLEESLKDFERGMALSKTCQEALTQAEQKVLILTQNEKGEQLVPFTPSSNNNPQETE